MSFRPALHSLVWACHTHYTAHAAPAENGSTGRGAHGARTSGCIVGADHMAKLPDELWRSRMKEADAVLARRIPPGQTLTAKWPVLTYGLTPRFDPARWTFRCFGRVEREVVWTWEEFLKLPRVTIISDVHCVTRWSKLDNVWEGVPIREIVNRARPRPEATFVMQHADPDYTTNI